MGACPTEQRNHVLADGVGDVYVTPELYQLANSRRAHDRLELVEASGERVHGEHFHLGGLIRVTHAHTHEEPVELGLGQRIGAFVLDRVLRGYHHERPLECVGVSVQGDLALFHRLEQRRLRLR